MIDLPEHEPCQICEGMAGRDPKWAVVDECTHTVTVINPYQFDVGQCCVVTKRHVATSLEVTDEQASSIIKAAKRVAFALVNAYRPLGVLTFQNDGGACRSMLRYCTRTRKLFENACPIRSSFNCFWSEAATGNF